MKEESFLPSKEQSGFIKLVGIISMFFDHLGKFFFPQLLILRIIGRIAFPLFAFQITVGFRKTSNLKNYLLRILFFGTISQVPYSILSGTFFPLNIFFTFFLSLLILSFFERKKYFLAFFCFLFSPLVEYDFYGTFLIFSFYLLPNLFGNLISLTVLNFFYIFFWENPLQMFSIFSLFFLLPKFQFKISLPQIFPYIFYPLHLTIICLFKFLS